MAAAAVPLHGALAPVIVSDGYNVRDAGANPDGKTLCTKAIQRAIDDVSKLGGGVAFFPPGEYLTGTIVLRNNVTLYLEAGAVLKGSGDRNAYTHPSLIYAVDAANVALRGRGAIDGNGTAFWKRNGNRWEAGEWRPEQLMHFVRCENLLLEGFTARNSPMWTIHPVDCDRVTITGISIINGLDPETHGPNTDGIDPDGCTRMRISDCYIQSGDDCIVLKVTKRPGGRRECRGITVTNCVLKTHETALKIGSETYGDFRDISFSNCAVLDAGCGIGLWMRDNGVIDGWVVNNVSMTLTDGGQPIYMTSYPRSGVSDSGTQRAAEAAPAGLVRNVTISNVVASGDGCIFIQGMKGQPIEGVVLEDIRIHMLGSVAKPLSANPPYPFPLWGHRQSPYGIYCRFAKDLTFRNVKVTWGKEEKAEWGGAIRCRDLSGVELSGFVGRQSLGSSSASIAVKDTSHVYIHDCWAPEGTRTFLSLEEGASDVALMDNNLSRASRLFEFAPGVSHDELFDSGNRFGR